MSGFVHLRTHTAYSLAEGALKVKDLVKLCIKQGMPAVGICDTNNLFGALEFAVEAAGAGIQPITALQVSITRPGEQRAGGLPKPPDQLVLIAQNEAGYRNLMKISSKLFLETPTNLAPQMGLDALHGHTDGLICLTGGAQGTIGRLLGEGHVEPAEQILLTLASIFPGRLYVELQRHGMAIEQRIETALVDLAYKHNLPLVATNDCFFSDETMYEAHDALLCIAEGTVISETKRRKVTPDHRFKSAAEMRVLFADLIEAVDNTVVIAKRCSYMPQKSKPLLPTFTTDKGLSEEEELRAQARAGLEKRIKTLGITDNETYTKRLEFELDVIIKMGFPGYFLIVSDFIKWAKAHDIPVGPGRGSGAGSVVAWALSITDLDPIRFGLLFERFLNPERVSMPDFDIDFCQDRRDEVIKYVQERYGDDKVAQIITFGKLQARAVLRDVGRVLALSYGQVDKLCKLVPNNPANPVTLEQAIEGEPLLREAIAREESNQRLVDIAKRLEGLYRHASTHAAGVVIGDRPLEEIVALYRDPRSPIPATQFNMKWVEPAGLVKFDFLGLKTLTVIQHAIRHVKEQEGVSIDLDTLPLDDKKSYELLSRAETTGVFQVESSGMRDVLRRMKPDRIEDLIALVALYRPGPMDNIPTYIAVKNGTQAADYLHPSLEPILKETYGIMVYQEQVMQIAQVLSGYSLGGADLLRRAMGKKIKEEMAAQRASFVKGAVDKGIDEEQAGSIFDKVDKFAGYGFNKSHAAAYAVVSYQTAYLKANYPHEFMAASMTYEMGDTDKLSQFRQETDRLGIKLMPPDVNRSKVTFAVEKQNDGTKAVRYALAAIKGVGAHAMQALIHERQENGQFKDIYDFFRRADYRSMNKKQMEGLIKAGALDSLSSNRAQLIKSLELLMGYGQSLQEEKTTGQSSLFGGDPTSQQPKLPNVQPWDSMTKLQNEFEAIGFFLSAHPLDQYRAILGRLAVVPSAELARRTKASNVTRYRTAGVVLGKQERVSKNGNRFAFVQVSDNTGVYEMTVFSETLATQRENLEPGKAILASVDVQMQDEGMRLTCFSAEPLAEAIERVQSGVLISLHSADRVGDIATLLKKSSGGKGKVSMQVETRPGQNVEISLPGGYRLDAEVHSALRTIPGVMELQTY